MNTPLSITKHAYCLIAHQDPYCLETLISLLDDDKNDIFLLIDKKADIKLLSNIKTQSSRLFVLPQKDRIDIRWGGLSQVKAELTLFKAAVSKHNYRFIHLLSGADLPLKSQKDIHSFFENFPKGSNVLSFSEGENIRKNVEFKTRYYHPYVEFQRYRGHDHLLHSIQDIAAKIIRKLMVSGQKLISYRRNWKDLELKKGSQWVSVSTEFAKYLVDNEKYILKRFKGVICPDEIFIHTLIYNSKFKDTIVDTNKENVGIVRYIDWKRGTPYTWKEVDFQELINSDAMFARKFSSNIDKKIIQKIKNHILTQE